jgi:hypothetical protein
MEIHRIASIGQFVEVDHRLTDGIHPVQYEVAADESGSARHNDHAETLQ